MFRGRPAFSSVLFVAGAIGTLMLSGGCDQLRGVIPVFWQDGATSTIFTARVHEEGEGMTCELEVARDGTTKREVLAKGADIRVLTMWRYKEWLLVCSGPYVLGGYDYDTRDIEVMNSPDLPFTVHRISGDPVTTKRIKSGEDKPPPGFEERGD